MLSDKVGLLGHYQNDIHMSEIGKNIFKVVSNLSKKLLKVIKKLSKAGENCQLINDISKGIFDKYKIWPLPPKVIMYKIR